MIFSYFPYCLVEQILVMIVQVPGHCLYFTFLIGFGKNISSLCVYDFLCSDIVFLLCFVFGLCVCFFFTKNSYLTRLQHLYT